MKENWKGVIGYEGICMVSDLGNVKTCDRMISVIDGDREYNKKIDGKPKAKTIRVGYHDIVRVSIGGKIHILVVHNIVYEAFVGIINEHERIVHKDGDVHNHNIHNLEVFDVGGGIKVGDVIGKRSIIGRKSGCRFICKCMCGEVSEVDGNQLLSGKCHSCRSCSLKKHGMAETRQHRIWGHLKSRCGNKNNTRYKDYGGRGICYDSKRETFQGFWEDMSEGYSDSLSIDRIDVNGNYCKENCRRATNKEQSNNMRTNVSIEYKGVTKSTRQWAESKGLLYSTLEARIRRGRTIERAIETKTQYKNT